MSEWLYAATFALSAAKDYNEKEQADIRAAEQRKQAGQQAAINHRLAYNAHLNLNQQQILEMQKFGFEKRDLQKSIRAKRATNEAIRASFGGDLGQQGATLDATILNINRHGYEALARKDLNFKIQAADFNVRHRNITLETESKNNQAFSFEQVIPKGTIEITFLIAFLGWMPTSLDISIWQSIWSVEKEKISHQKITPKQAIFDFNVGYIGTIFLAACFLILGALVMHNSEQSFSNKGGVFAGQLIELYTKNLGNFAYVFIAIAALTTMFSTTITALDASPRAMSKANELLFPTKIKLNYWFWIVVLSLGTFIILKYFSDNMGLMVKIGTILSFLTAPFYAILNYILITGKHTPKEHRPSIYLKILSICGIIFLVGFSAWFLLNL